MAGKLEKEIDIARMVCLAAVFGGILPFNSAHAPKMAYCLHGFVSRRPRRFFSIDHRGDARPSSRQVARPRATPRTGPRRA